MNIRLNRIKALKGYIKFLTYVHMGEIKGVSQGKIDFVRRQVANTKRNMKYV